MTTTISGVPEDVSRQSRASGTKEEHTTKFPQAAETKDLEKGGFGSQPIVSALLHRNSQPIVSAPPEVLTVSGSKPRVRYIE